MEALMQTKQSGIEDILGRIARTTGSVRGPNAPSMFKNIGGPLTGSLVRSLLLGGLGYGAGRLLTPLYSDRLDPRRVGRLGGVLGALAGASTELPYVLNNVTRARKAGIPLTSRNFFSTLNTPAWERLRKSGGFGDSTGAVTQEGQHFNPYAPSIFDHENIPVGRMSDLIARSGAGQSAVVPMITTLREAAGGRSRGLVSPSQVMTTGMRLGVGFIVGRPVMKVLSKTLGAVANLPVSSQEKLTRYGTLGIMLGNAFGGNK